MAEESSTTHTSSGAAPVIRPRSYARLGLSILLVAIAGTIAYLYFFTRLGDQLDDRKFVRRAIRLALVPNVKLPK